MGIHIKSGTQVVTQLPVLLSLLSELTVCLPPAAAPEVNVCTKLHDNNFKTWQDISTVNITVLKHKLGIQQ